MSRCAPEQVFAMLEGLMESSLAYCGFYRSPTRLRGLARELALLAGLDEQRAGQVGQATALCDLGMMGMPHQLLAHDGPLNATEREALQHHTIVGQELLSMVDHPGFAMAAIVAATHHERLDGKGYPHGLDAAQITIEARIAAVVSIYVALTQPRPFRKMRSHDEAIELLRNLAGTQLDPGLVELLVDHQERFREPDPVG
jgi:putative two-component system response regulator